MKKALLLAGTALGLFAAKPAQAQFNYTFKDTTVPYTPLTGGTSINNGIVWDEDAFAVRLPFHFKINGVVTDTFFLDLSLVGFERDTINQTSVTGFIACDADLADRGTLNGTTSVSPVSYVVSGTSPNRIFKAEIRNAGFYNELQYNTMDDSVNIQIWLYETSNVIEMHYGPSKISYPADYYNFGNGPLIGELANVDGSTGASGMIYNLSGSATAPTIDSIAFPPMSANVLDTWPPNGSVYRFTPKTTSTNPNGVAHAPLLSSVKVYPTHTATSIQVDYSDAAEAHYSILSADGREVATGILASGKNRIDVSSAAAGMYILQVRSEAGIGVYRFVKE